jgi:hypothetical protein
MKKVCLIGLMLSLFTSSQAGTIDWASADLGAGYTAGWVIALYEDVDKDGWNAASISSAGLTDSDDAFLSITTALGIGKAGTSWLDSFAAPSGDLTFNDRIYSVLFNASSIAAATQYQVTTMTSQGNSWYELPSTDIDAGYTTTTMSGWQAVPEPATFLLFGMGGFGAWLIRRKNRITKEEV